MIGVCLEPGWETVGAGKRCTEFRRAFPEERTGGRRGVRFPSLTLDSFEFATDEAAISGQGQIVVRTCPLVDQ